MACDELKQQRKEITEQAIKDHQLATTTGTTTGQFKCGRCGKRNTTYNQVMLLEIYLFNSRPFKCQGYLENRRFWGKHFQEKS